MSDLTEIQEYDSIETVELEEGERIEFVGGLPGRPGTPGAKGDKGDKGDTGDAGDAVGNFHYETAIAINPWPVQHNLGYFPALGRCQDDAGTDRHPTVTHIDANNLELSFIGDTAGEADFS